MRKIKAFKISLRHIFPCFFNKWSHIFTVIWAHTFFSQLWRENVCDEASEWGVNRSRKTLQSRWRSMTSFQAQPEELRYLQWAVLGGQSDTSNMFIPHSPHYHSRWLDQREPIHRRPNAPWPIRCSLKKPEPRRVWLSQETSQLNEELRMKVHKNLLWHPRTCAEFCAFPYGCSACLWAPF